MNASTSEQERAACPLDPLVNKTTDFAYRGVRLKFDLSHALFSSFDIDAGTRLLLKEIVHEPGIVEARRVLDAGCGTGVIGISLAASCPDMEVVMRDRDFRAVAFAARNASRNGLAVKLQGLDGTELAQCAKRPFAKIKVAQRNAALIAAPGLLCEPDPNAPYEAVVANLPAKAGPALLSQYFVAVGRELLREGGTFAFVIVAPLAEQARAWCMEAGFEILRTVSTKNHMVCIARTGERRAGENAVKEALAELGRGKADQWFKAYVRSHVKKSIAGALLVWDGIQGLPEFDEPSFATLCALALGRQVFAGSLVRRALVIEPGVGIVPMWCKGVLGSSEIILKSHDVLALTASGWNLKRAGFDNSVRILEPAFAKKENSAGEPALNCADRGMEVLAPFSIDAAILFPEDIPKFDSASYYWPLLSRVLKRGAVAVIASNATYIERFVRQKPSGFSKLPQGEHKKGWEAVAFRRE
ncbi:MAG: methyltransferase [Rectinema subterraneum]